MRCARLRTHRATGRGDGPGRRGGQRRGSARTSSYGLTIPPSGIEPVERRTDSAATVAPADHGHRLHDAPPTPLQMPATGANVSNATRRIPPECPRKSRTGSRPGVQPDQRRLTSSGAAHRDSPPPANRALMSVLAGPAPAEFRRHGRCQNAGGGQHREIA